MKGQTSLEALIVLAAYLAFLGTLVFYTEDLEKKLRDKNDFITAEWSAERVATLENFFTANGRNSAWKASTENCSISENATCTFGKATASKKTVGGLNETEKWKQPV
ncbi:hypothetical protein HY992_02965 [Candidatus Micrarchaeota archaeon]|nr:hypothetical protein [Candidatus Micrarchaeota archaeon]